MGLFKRVGDIVSANLNEMVEHFEDPEKMLKQAIREMEVSIDSATKDAAKVIASEKRLTKELAHNQSEAESWQARAGQAVAAGDDNLARKALQRKQEHVKLVTALQDQYDSTKESADTLRKQLDGMKAKHGEAKRSLATFVAKKKAADVRLKMQSELGKTAALESGSSAFQKFVRMKDKVEQAEAEAEALAELRQSPDDELLNDSGDDDIDAQLAELKRNRPASE